jgi:predicted DNA-binding transcriptional regulator YafY
MFLAGTEAWYLVAWCRLREELRAFRLNRIVSAHDTGEPVPARAPERHQLPEHVTQVAVLA